MREFVDQIERDEHAEEPLVLSFGLMIEDVVNSEALSRDVPRDYPYLCDWLELDLVNNLRAIITTPFHYTQPSERWGDGLSVRIVFPDLNDLELERLNLPWWEIIEAANFWQIFVCALPDGQPTLKRHVVICQCCLLYVCNRQATSLKLLNGFGVSTTIQLQRINRKSIPD